jgi:hypothetical protein
MKRPRIVEHLVIFGELGYIHENGGHDLHDEDIPNEYERPFFDYDPAHVSIVSRVAQEWCILSLILDSLFSAC